ncbi:MAG: HEAT repeat domain-containing protein, partial [Candidatus Tectomicrobia bacterium]
MSLLDKYRIKKSIDTVISSPDSNNPETAQAIAKLKEFDRATIPKLIEVLASPTVPAPLIDLLASFVCNDTLQLYVKELGHSDHRVVAGVTRLLSTSRNFNPNSLLEYFSNPKISTSALTQILTHHKETLTGEAILGLLDIMNQDTRSVILRLLDEVATESMVSVLIPLTTADDWIMRLSIVRILGRFDTPEVQQTLVALLKDPHKSIRQTALGALASSKNPANIGSICQLLRDPDLTVQSKAIEVVIQTNAPQTVQYLLELLQDDSEYVRRGAVEILNAIGDTSAIKDLLGVLRDKDWWVRVRAADALGTIGGPAVIDAVLELIKDEDEFIRRCAVEILNTIPDDHAFNALVQALHDEDWWVRERAIDALTQLGDARAVPALLALLGKDAKTNGVAIKALAALGDASTLPPLLAMLKSSESGVPQEVLQALVALATEQHAAIVQDAIQDVSQSATGSLKEAANASLKALIDKFGDQRSMPQARAPQSMRDGQQRQPAISAAEIDSCLASQDDLSQVQAAPRDLPRTPTTNGDN